MFTSVSSFLLHVLSSFFVIACSSELSTCFSSSPKSHWFLLHSVVNVYILVLTFEDMLSSAGDLFETGLCFGPAPLFPITITVCLHLWHVLFYDMTTQDRIHHFFFIPLVGVPGMIYDWGGCGNCQLFFLCGLPGSLIYFLLHMRKEGRLLWVDEPLFSALVNVFLRMPGGLLCWSRLASTWYHSHEKVTVPLFPLFLQLAVSPSNSIFYCLQSVSRWRRRRNSTL